MLVPAAPRWVFDLVTMGNLPIRCSQWTLASAPPDDDQQLDRYPCLPVNTIWDMLNELWTPPPADLLLQKCQLYAGLLLADVNGLGIIAQVGALRMHSLAELVALLFPEAYSRQWDHSAVLNTYLAPAYLAPDLFLVLISAALCFPPP